MEEEQKQDENIIEKEDTITENETCVNEEGIKKDYSVLERIIKSRPNVAKAIQARYEGQNFTNVAGILNITPDTARCYFAKGGRLNVLYRDYADFMNAQLLEEAQDGLKSSVNAATSVLISLLSGKTEYIKDDNGKIIEVKKKQDHIRLNAAKEIIERVAGKAEQKIKFEDETDDVGKLMEKFNLKVEDLDDKNREETIRKILRRTSSGEDKT